jgi:hypothetical protein
MSRVFSRSFNPIYGRPWWGVRPGHGSFLTLEFGEPHLSVREPRDAPSDTSSRVRKLLERRNVTLRGDWHLWIYCCNWTVREDGKIIGDSTSNRRIKRAAEALDGQQLESFTFSHRGCRSSFVFDLGGVLETCPYDRASEQWLLYQPSGKVLTLRADKKYSHHAKDAPPSTERWHPIAKKA